MPKITLSKEVHSRLIAFQRVVRPLMDEELSLDETAEMLLCHSMDATLANLWGTQEPQVIVQALQKLAARHPEEVYSFVGDVLNAGSQEDRERAKQQFGFHPPERT